MKKYKSKALWLIAILATLFIWTDTYGFMRMWWQNDGWNDVRQGPPYARPTPNPHPPIVHPRIMPAATPIPGTGRPPAI